MGNKVEEYVTGILEMRTPEGAVIGTDGVATSLPGHLRFQTGQAVLAKAEEGAEGEAAKPRRFAMAPAYSGAPVATWWGRLVLDLEGMDLGRPAKPILREHMRDRVVGQSDSVEITDAGVVIEASLSQVTPDGLEVAGLGDEGFPFEASIGFDIHRVEFIEEGDSKKVNGAEFAGPGYVATKTALRESSFVALGADKDTAGVVLADGDGGRLVEVARRMADEQEEHMSEQTAASAAAPDPASGAGDMVRLAALRAAYPDHQGFALEQFDAGNGVAEAVPAFAKLMREEAAAESAAKDARIQELEAARGARSGSAGVGFAAGEAQDRAGTAEALEHLPVEERAGRMFETDAEFRGQFSSVEEAAAYLRAEEDGRVKIYAPTGAGIIGGLSEGAS